MRKVLHLLQAVLLAVWVALAVGLAMPAGVAAAESEYATGNTEDTALLGESQSEAPGDGSDQVAVGPPEEDEADEASESNLQELAAGTGAETLEAQAGAGGFGVGSMVYYGRYFQVPVTSSGLDSRIQQYAERLDDGLRVLDGVTYRLKGDTYYRPMPISWYVIADEGGTLTLLSTKVLDSMAYSSNYAALWNESTIRSWLNGFFLTNAFTEEERAYIPMTANPYLVYTYDDWLARSAGEYATSTEQVYLLDREDIASDVLGKTGVPVVANATPYVDANEGAYRWWLRGNRRYSYGNEQNDFIGADGAVASYYPTWDRGVRPVIRVEKGAPGLTDTEPETPEVTVPSTYTLRGRSAVRAEDIYVEGCLWDDGWLSQNSFAYNHDLAATLSVLASAAYSEDAAGESLVTLGCDKGTISPSFPSDAAYKKDINRVAYTFGTKELADGTPVVFVLVRGTPGNIEWESNFNVADTTYPNKDHEGFIKAFYYLRDDLDAYVEELGIDPGSAKFVVTGHSRGAAVANLLGQSLDIHSVSSAAGSSDASNTYVYTFACPKCTTRGNMGSSSYGNIFNIVNPEDTVPRVALSKWGFGRYGKTLTLPSKSTRGRTFANLYDRVASRFSEMAGKSYNPYRNGAQTARGFEDALGGDVPTIENYLNDRLYYYTRVVSVGPVPIITERHGGFTVSEAFQSIGDFLGNNGEPVKNKPDIPLTEVALALAETKPRLAAKALKGVLVDEGLSTIYPSFYHAHAPETYMAWMLEGEYGVSGDTSFFVDEYTCVKIACPVDVVVTDGSGEVVCRITGDVVDEDVMAQDNGLAASVDNGVKVIDIPSDEAFNITVKATDGGTMDVVCEGLDAEGHKESQVSYDKLKLTKGKSYALAVDEVAEDDDVVADWVGLKNPSGKVVKPSASLAANQLDGLKLSLSVGAGEGVADGPATMSRGDQVSVYAVPAGGWEFSGWYEGGKLVSEEAVWTFRADADRTLEARFEAVENLGVLASGTWGTCPWEIDADGTLTVHPGTGADTQDRSPWAEWSDEVKAVRFVEEGGKKVVAPKDCEHLFYYFDKMVSADLSALDTHNTTCIACMFQGCTALSRLDLSTLDVSKVKVMVMTFAYCRSLASLDLSGWDTSSATDMGSMFTNCKIDVFTVGDKYVPLYASGIPASEAENGKWWSVKSGTWLTKAQVTSRSRSRIGDTYRSGVMSPFTDVPAPTSHYEDILWLADTGISAGWTKEDGTREFRPKANVARCDMAAFLFRLAKRWGVVDDSWQPAGTYKFVDVTEKTSHRIEVLWMAESGISTGWKTEAGAEFRPKDPVTRGQMAAFMQRLAVKVAGKKGGASSPQNFFRDVNAKTSFHSEIWWLAGNGVTQGWSKNGGREFRPNANVTRGDMAAFLHRLDGVK